MTLCPGLTTTVRSLCPLMLLLLLPVHVRRRECTDAGCDYIDLCGEPEFMARMKLKYHTQASVS
jgi:hypothetical protein